MTKASGQKQLVAIKLMPHKSRKEQKMNFSECFYLKECNHPNVVSFKEAHIVANEIWVLMEFLEGGTLQEASKTSNFGEPTIAYIAREMLKGVKYVHEKGWAHRDIKSANVMMSVKGDVKLIDFGLARDLKDGQVAHMCGSPFWMPPEMIKRIPHGNSVDIWSSGICLLELMDGEVPNKSSSIKAMFLVGVGDAPVPKRPDKWSFKCKKFIEDMLEVNHLKRPSAENLLKKDFLNSACDRKDICKILLSIFYQNTLSKEGL